MCLCIFLFQWRGWSITWPCSTRLSVCFNAWKTYKSHPHYAYSTSKNPSHAEGEKLKCLICEVFWCFTPSSFVFAFGVRGIHDPLLNTMHTCVFCVHVCVFFFGGCMIDCCKVSVGWSGVLSIYPTIEEGMISFFRVPKIALFPSKLLASLACRPHDSHFWIVEWTETKKIKKLRADFKMNLLNNND